MNIPTRDPVGLGKRLKRVRSKHFLTQTKLAEDIGASKASVCLLESGKIKDVSARFLLLLAKRLRVDPAWLIFGKCFKCFGKASCSHSAPLQQSLRSASS